jgi:hypothetical protein
MRANEIHSLINMGAGDRVRQYLKKLSLKDRLPALHDLIPYVDQTPGNLKFFRDHFSVEIGALISAKYDYEKAEKLYNTAKLLK